MKTKEQTKERRTQVIQKALFHSYSEFSRSLAGALACSDKEANWPFNPETHVVVPREPTKRMVSKGEAALSHEQSAKNRVWEIYQTMLTASQEQQK